MINKIKTVISSLGNEIKLSKIKPSGLERFAKKNDQVKQVNRKIWPLDQEPTHLPKDQYYKADIGIYRKILVWQESDEAFRERIRTEIIEKDGQYLIDDESTEHLVDDTKESEYKKSSQ